MTFMYSLSEMEMLQFAKEGRGTKTRLLFTTSVYVPGEPYLTAVPEGSLDSFGTHV